MNPEEGDMLHRLQGFVFGGCIGALFGALAYQIEWMAGLGATIGLTVACRKEIFSRAVGLRLQEALATGLLTMLAGLLFATLVSLALAYHDSSIPFSTYGAILWCLGAPSFLVGAIIGLLPPKRRFPLG